jgi:hypothetical protein
VACLSHSAGLRPCCKPDLHPTAERAQAARRRNNTHQAPSANIPPPPPHPPPLLSPTPLHTTATTPSTTPRCCTPPSGESGPRPACFPTLPATLAPAHVPSYIYPGLSLACAKSTPTPTAILIIHLNILAARTSAKQTVYLQTTAQSHCKHPSTSPSVRAGCESRTPAASPVPRPSTPLPAVQPRVIRIHHGGPGSRRRAVPDCCPH